MSAYQRKKLAKAAEQDKAQEEAIARARARAEAAKHKKPKSGDEAGEQRPADDAGAVETIEASAAQALGQVADQPQIKFIYGIDAQRFWRGITPNATVPFDEL